MKAIVASTITEKIEAYDLCLLSFTYTLYYLWEEVKIDMKTEGTLYCRNSLTCKWIFKELREER